MNGAYFKKIVPHPLASRQLGRFGFSLVELLTVMAIIGLLSYLTLPALSSLQNNQSLSAAADNLGDVLKEARAYAMGNNTHVFVGMAEYDASKASTLAPQVAGNGRVVVMAVASIDGTSLYDTASGSWTGTATNLVPILKPTIFENTHLAYYLPDGDGETPPMTGFGSMKRPVYTPNYNVGNSSFTASTSFNYPLTGTPRYIFDKVIDFDSGGVARVINFDQANTTAIPGDIEIDVQHTHGTLIPANPSDDNPLNYMAVQCDGMTGTVQVYK